MGLRFTPPSPGLAYTGKARSKHGEKRSEMSCADETSSTENVVVAVRGLNGLQMKAISAMDEKFASMIGAIVLFFIQMSFVKDFLCPAGGRSEAAGFTSDARPMNDWKRIEENIKSLRAAEVMTEREGEEERAINMMICDIEEEEEEEEEEEQENYTKHRGDCAHIA
eukprot:757112-Hanusia_phi.AAC.4